MGARGTRQPRETKAGDGTLLAAYGRSVAAPCATSLPLGAPLLSHGIAEREYQPASEDSPAEAELSRRLVGSFPRSPPS